MKEKTMHPLGSVVILEGGEKKVMIIARGVAMKQEGEMQYFEYGGCLYPEGLMGDQILYFNGENIQTVTAEGYSDEEDQLLTERLEEWIEKSHIKKGQASNWNKKK